MNQAALVIGAFIAGWVLPELALVVGSRTDIPRMPGALNWLTGVAAALIAFGLSV